MSYLLEQMAEALHNKQRDLNGDVGKNEFDWNRLNEDGKQDARESVAAAFEVLKASPDSFVETMAGAHHDSLSDFSPWCSLTPESKAYSRYWMKAALRVAINQALKEVAS